MPRFALGLVILAFLALALNLSAPDLRAALMGGVQTGHVTAAIDGVFEGKWNHSQTDPDTGLTLRASGPIRFEIDSANGTFTCTLKGTGGASGSITVEGTPADVSITGTFSSDSCDGSYVAASGVLAGAISISSNGVITVKVKSEGAEQQITRDTADNSAEAIRGKILGTDGTGIITNTGSGSDATWTVSGSFKAAEEEEVVVEEEEAAEEEEDADQTPAERWKSVRDSLGPLLEEAEAAREEGLSPLAAFIEELRSRIEAETDFDAVMELEKQRSALEDQYRRADTQFSGRMGYLRDFGELMDDFSKPTTAELVEKLTKAQSTKETNDILLDTYSNLRKNHPDITDVEESRFGEVVRKVSYGVVGHSFQPDLLNLLRALRDKKKVSLNDLEISSYSRRNQDRGPDLQELDEVKDKYLRSVRELMKEQSDKNVFETFGDYFASKVLGRKTEEQELKGDLRKLHQKFLIDMADAGLNSKELRRIDPPENAESAKELVVQFTKLRSRMKSVLGPRLEKKRESATLDESDDKALKGLVTIGSALQTTSAWATGAGGSEAAVAGDTFKVVLQNASQKKARGLMDCEAKSGAAVEKCWEDFQQLSIY